MCCDLRLAGSIWHLHHRTERSGTSGIFIQCIICAFEVNIRFWRIDQLFGCWIVVFGFAPKGRLNRLRPMLWSTVARDSCLFTGRVGPWSRFTDKSVFRPKPDGRIGFWHRWGSWRVRHGGYQTAIRWSRFSGHGHASGWFLLVLSQSQIGARRDLSSAWDRLRLLNSSWCGLFYGIDQFLCTNCRSSTFQQRSACTFAREAASIIVPPVANAAATLQ